MERTRLSDIERKVLRIIINVSFYGALPMMPTITELQKWTGRNRGGVYTVLAGLARKGYIKWSVERPAEIKLIQTGEGLQRRGNTDWF